jgi:hypoxanthine phosphoribosyltransferase
MNKLILSNTEFNGCVISILQQMMQDKWIPDYIVGITRGGLTPAVMLSQYLNVPLNTLKISLRDADENGCESNLWMSEDAFGYDKPPMKILVVDDINDTGATINWLMKDWQGSCFPQGDRWKDTWGNNVKFAVIVDNLSSKCDVKMNYVGMEVNKAEEDVWVEFPYENWWKK